MIKPLLGILHATAYHVWRSMRGRPQFVHLADNDTTLITFWLTLGVSSMAVTFTHFDGLEALLLGLARWIGTCFVLRLLLTGLGGSQLLLASAYAAMAGFDVLDIGQLMAVHLISPGASSLLATAGGLAIGILRIVSLTRLRAHFLSMPAYIRAPGYIPSAHTGTKK